MSRFNIIQRILRKRSHYRAALLDTGKHGEVVLADLRRFCRGNGSPLVISGGTTDTFATAVAIGRREVFDRIAQMLHLDDAQLLNLKEEADHD